MKHTFPTKEIFVSYLEKATIEKCLHSPIPLDGADQSKSNIFNKKLHMAWNVSYVVCPCYVLFLLVFSSVFGL